MPMSGLVGFVSVGVVAALMTACGAGGDGSSTDPDDGETPEAVVAAAIENTLATSWVSTLTFEGDGAEAAGTQTTTYHPADPARGADYSSLEVVSELPAVDVKARSVLPPDGSGLLMHCPQDAPPPCEKGLWIESEDVAGWRAGESSREGNESLDSEALYTGLGGVLADTARAVPGEPSSFDVEVSFGEGFGADMCPDGNCTGRVQLANGLVVQLDVDVAEGVGERAGVFHTWVWAFGSFGEAPDIDVPGSAEVVRISRDELGIGPVCSVFVEVEPGSDTGEIERIVGAYIDRNGAFDQQLHKQLLGIDGYIGPVSREVGDCAAEGVSVGFTMVNEDVAADDQLSPSTTALSGGSGG